MRVVALKFSSLDILWGKMLDFERGELMVSTGEYKSLLNVER